MVVLVDEVELAEVDVGPNPPPPGVYRATDTGLLNGLIPGGLLAMVGK